MSLKIFVPFLTNTVTSQLGSAIVYCMVFGFWRTCSLWEEGKLQQFFLMLTIKLHKNSVHSSVFSSFAPFLSHSSLECVLAGTCLSLCRL